MLGDSSPTPIRAREPDEVRSQMPIYAPKIYADNIQTSSTRTAKTGVEPVDPEAVLAGVEQLEVSTWEFIETDDGRHMGPMAEDFHEVFDLSDDDQTIPTVDADGVTLAAIQGLSTKLDEKEERIADLEQENKDLEDRVADLEKQLGSSR